MGPQFRQLQPPTCQVIASAALLSCSKMGPPSRRAHTPSHPRGPLLLAGLAKPLICGLELALLACRIWRECLQGRHSDERADDSLDVSVVRGEFGMANKSKIDWNIELNFESPTTETEPSPPPPKPKAPPREILKEKYPRILDKINLLWGTTNLHKYFEETLFTDRDKRQGFPPEVMDALGKIHGEHQQLLMRNGIIRLDVWDMQFSGVMAGKTTK